MYLTGTDGASYSPYAYDPFGNRIDPKTGKRESTSHSHGYVKTGNIIQPFAFTGYREEESGLCYAQARNYDPISGRFIGEDKVRGITLFPQTQNHYVYCFSNPLIMVDVDGYWPSVILTNSPFNAKGIRGTVLKGDLILEVPVQNEPVPQSVIDTANTKGITIRDVTGKVYN